MARQVPFAPNDTYGFYGGSATVPIIVNGKTKLAQSSGSSGKPTKDTSGSSATVASKPPKKTGGKKHRDKPQKEAYNPFTAPFKTPNELRAEAARLAAMASVSEDALRQQQAAESAGISGLTTALTNRLGGISNEYLAGLRGLQTGYQGVAQGAQTAGESAAAAAGAPTGMAAGALPTQAAFAALGAVPATYAPAAALTGTRLQAESSSNLTKALAERAAKVSSDTARYLQQLRDTELQRAISKQTASQNAARLNLSQQTAEFGQKMDVAKFQLSQQRLAAQIARDLRKEKQTGSKGIQSAKDKILNNVNKWRKPKSVQTGEYNFTLTIGGNPYYQTGTTADDALGKLIESGQVDAGSKIESSRQGSAVTKSVNPTNDEILAMLVPILTNKGMSKKNARAWVVANVLSVA